MEQRICVVCSKPIGALRRSTMYCGRSCQETAARTKHDAKKPIPTGWLVHSCHSPDLHELLPARCKCKKRVNDAQMRDMLANAEIVELFGHPGQFGYTGRRKMVPRTPSIEKSHIERSVVSKKPKEHRLTQAQIDELLRMREETRASFEQEARCRWEIYNELSVEALNAITVPEVDDGWGIGRCLFSSSWEDERTSVGKTIDSAYVPDVFEEEQLEGEVVERDENMISLDESQVEPEPTEEYEYVTPD